jgi:hypothetical protein
MQNEWQPLPSFVKLQRDTNNMQVVVSASSEIGFYNMAICQNDFTGSNRQCVDF